MKKKVIITLVMLGVLSLGMAGCQNEKPKEEANKENTVTEEQGSNVDYESYIVTIEEQSDDIKYALENEVVTQIEMNEKSQELFELWDGALNYLWGELKNVLSEKEFEELRDEQRTWIAQKEEAVEAAGKEVEGGSLYSMVVNTEAAKITEKRVYELYELLK